jgi:hypothetical protein
VNRWWKRWRRRSNRPAERPEFELREFVYLDEVSITSLLSSRLGKMPNEFTDTLTNATKAELNSSIQAGAAILKSGIGSRFESSSSADSKIVSKATIQASFKSLYDEEKESLAMRPTLLTEPVPDADQVAEALTPGRDDIELTPWLISPRQMKRGRLAEVEVELQADPVFRASTIVTTFAELASESKTLLAQARPEELEKAIELNRILDKLMAGLIPLKCRIVDYCAVTVGREEYLVHRRALNQLAPMQRPSPAELYLVGVAEKALFWKDIRRVLFSKAQFRVFCRLNHDAVRSSWTGVKLVNVLGEVAPDLERQIGSFGTGLMSAMTSGASSNTRSFEPCLAVLTTFGELLAEQLGLALDDSDRQEIEIYAGEAVDRFTSILEKRTVFAKVTELLAARASIEVSPTVAAQLRFRACQQHGLLPGGSDLRIATAFPPVPASQVEERFLDTEIIAIYW